MNIAIVTGASSGLGGEFVRRIDGSGELDEIWVIARRRERLEALRRQVRTPLRVLALDLTERASFDTLSGLLARERPRVRLLINAAGFGKIGSWKDISLRDCGDMIDLNCRAAVMMTQLALPYMAKGARVMEISSTSAFQPFPFLNVYSASKTFLYRYSRALRAELRGTGISVTVVCPYWIKDTEFIAKAQKTENSGYIRSFPFASREDRVALRALKASARGRAVCTPGFLCTGHRVLSKVLPSAWLMGFWALLRRI